MKKPPQTTVSSRGVGVLALPVVRPPDPVPAWILARADALPPADGGAVSPGGVEEGYAEGLRRAESAILAQRQRLGAALEAIEALRERMPRDNETHVVDLALAVARELTMHAARTDRDLAVRLARAALEDLSRSARVGLRCAPVDREAIEAWLVTMPAGHGPAIAVIEDAALAPGEVIAEADAGRVDGRLETRLARVARALQEGGAA